MELIDKSAVVAEIEKVMNEQQEKCKNDVANGKEPNPKNVEVIYQFQQLIKVLNKLERLKTVNEDAEKEKYDYVSGQFLYCKGSFNDFKEGESYWLEYIGNDTYVGRSDNILNQKFHITPRQLYTWLDPRHPESPKEDTPMSYGKELEIKMIDACKRYFSNGVDTLSLAGVFYAGVEAQKEIMQKPADNVKPKFNEGDWIVNHNVVYHIDKISGVYLTLSTLNGTALVYHKSVLDSDKIHLWTIADAKDGDILVASDGSIFLFAGVDDCACKYYVALTNYNDIKDGYWETSRAVHPANKEQRDLLFQKMEEAGWKWDAEAKKLEAFPILSNSSKTINDWTEEDECYMGECISAIATKDSWSFEEKRKTKHWLKSIKQRLEQ